MARRIEGTIYRLTYATTWHDYVECSSKEDLFKYVAQEIANGQIVTSVNEMSKDGSTPKVRVLTDKDFKKILKQYQILIKVKKKWLLLLSQNADVV